jgi:hypothetical protein
MVHFDNLESIFQRRALLSKEKLLQEYTAYRSIAYDNVQKLRDRVFVWDASEYRFRPLHSYVPFYFAARTPMLYIQFKQGIQSRLAIFEVSRSIITEKGVVFTDGNASNQQLTADGSEVVRIMPMTPEKRTCRRKYYPNGPYGTNPNCSDFYSGPEFLEELDWSVINHRDFSGADEIRLKHAEVLIPDILPLSNVLGIAVNNRVMQQDVNNLISQCGLAMRIPFAVIKTNLFF